MKNRHLFFFSLCLISFLIFNSLCFAQWFNWVEQAGGSDYEYSADISIDADGNSYITGYFLGTATFGTTQLVSYGYYDMFIAKYGTNGNFLWVKQAGGSERDEGYGISVDANGNSYVTGTFSGTAIFGTTQLVSYGLWDIFIAKYDASGNFLWVKQAGGSDYDSGYGISIDANGNSYVTGAFSGTAIFGTTQLVSYGSDDAFIAKYDANGNLLWVKQAGGSDFDSSSDIYTDTNGNVYVTGYFASTATFGATQLVSYGSDDIFIVKFDTNGNFLWVKQAGGSDSDWGSDISTDANGNSYVTGIFASTATFGTTQLVSYGDTDIFIAKYDANGSFLWVKQAGGSDFDRGRAISTDANGNSYVTGHFKSIATFGATQLVTHLTQKYMYS